jgi:hypothetical protein
MFSTCFGVVAEWSKAQVLGTCLFGGVGSNPIDAIFVQSVGHFGETACWKSIAV